jgi:hypothetical protein
MGSTGQSGGPRCPDCQAAYWFQIAPGAGLPGRVEVEELAERAGVAVDDDRVTVAIRVRPALDGHVGRDRVRPGIALRVVVELDGRPGLRRPDDGDGIPIGPPSQRPEPKSAWTSCMAPIELTSVRESLRTGSLSTGLFHKLDAGKIGQLGAPGSGEPRAVGAARRAAASAVPSASLMGSLWPSRRVAVNPRAGGSRPPASSGRSRSRSAG